MIVDIVTQTYNLLEYNNNLARSAGSSWVYFKVIPNDNIATSNSFKFKASITGRTLAESHKNNTEIVVPLKQLSNFWRNHEMPLINCEINIQLTWSLNCVITNSTGIGILPIKNTILYNPLVTLSTQDNTKLLQQLNSGS